MIAVLAHLAYTFAFVVVMAVLLILGIAVHIEWCKSVFRAGDYLVAALFGGDGKHSVSAYCGAGTTWVHAMLREIIDAAFGPGHCVGAAQREGLL